MRPGIVLPPLDSDEDDEEWSPPVSAIQRKKLWPGYLHDKQRAIDLADGDDLFVLMIGDSIQGTLLPDQLLVSHRLSDQEAIAEDFFEPWLLLPNFKFMRLIKGTAAHVMKAGSAELTIARHLKQKHGADVSAWYHLDLTAYGVEIDLAHHGPATGSRAWLEGNELRLYVKSIMSKSLEAGRRPPDLVLRGHYHDRIIELVHKPTWGEMYKTWAAVCPAYSIFGDDYTRKATKSKDHMTYGMLAVEIIDGRIKEIWDWAHTIDVRRHESVS